MTAPLVDCHLHLDASLTAGRPRFNESGTLIEGIEVWGELKPTLTEQDVVDLLKTGRTGFSAVHGPMTEVVQDSTQYMSDADLKAIFAFLRTTKPVKHRVDNAESSTECKVCKQRHGAGNQNQ